MRDVGDIRVEGVEIDVDRVQKRDHHSRCDQQPAYDVSRLPRDDQRPYGPEGKLEAEEAANVIFADPDGGETLVRDQ